MLGTKMMVWPSHRKTMNDVEIVPLQTPRKGVTPKSVAKRRRLAASATKRTIIVVEAKNENNKENVKQPVANHLVEFLRSRRAQQEEAKKIRLIPGFENEGFCTPRSSERKRSPPHLGRTSSSRSSGGHHQLLQTPVSSARWRIQSPAPANDLLAEYLAS
jgi:hypothetical protein